MIIRPSKALLNALNSHEVSLFKQGFFPEVNYQESQGCTSFNLYEKMASGKILFKCLDFSMINNGIELGAFSRKHGDKFISDIKKQILDPMIPFTSDFLKNSSCKGKWIKLWGIEDKWNFREGKIVEKIYMDGIIFDVEVFDTNGNFNETGSAYIWEIAMIQDSNGYGGNVWKPFHLSVEEKAIRKEIYA